ncbi:MAG: hypothetical protein JSS32_02810 [Verrucomicrobia bacterium]|nr:hypothetical protein [Verrucomicrobiota bacterium]
MNAVQHRVIESRTENVEFPRSKQIVDRSWQPVSLKFQVWEYQKFVVFDSETRRGATLSFQLSNEQASATVKLKLTIDKIDYATTGKIGYRFQSGSDISLRVKPPMNFVQTLDDETIIVKED